MPRGGSGLDSNGEPRLTPWTVPEQGIPVPLAQPGQHLWGCAPSSPHLPLHHLAAGGDKGAERGHLLGVGRSVGLGLFMQVLEGRFLSSVEQGVAAGTNQPLVWGIVGDGLSHRPFRWVLLLWKHITNHLGVGVSPAKRNRNISSLLPALHASWYSAFYPPGSWIPVMQSERGSLRYRGWYQNSLLLGSHCGSSCCVWQHVVLERQCTLNSCSLLGQKKFAKRENWSFYPFWHPLVSFFYKVPFKKYFWWIAVTCQISSYLML